MCRLIWGKGTNCSPHSGTLQAVAFATKKAQHYILLSPQFGYHPVCCVRIAEDAFPQTQSLHHTTHLRVSNRCRKIDIENCVWENCKQRLHTINLRRGTWLTTCTQRHQHEISLYGAKVITEFIPNGTSVYSAAGYWMGICIFYEATVTKKTCTCCNGKRNGTRKNVWKMRSLYWGKVRTVLKCCA